MPRNNVFLKKFMISIVLTLCSGGLSFNEINRKIKSTPATTSNRLRELRDKGLARLSLVDERRVYELTEKGRKLVPILERVEALLARAEDIVTGE